MGNKLDCTDISSDLVVVMTYRYLSINKTLPNL